MMAGAPSWEWTDEALAVLAARDRDGEQGRRAACILLERYVKPAYRWCYDRARDTELAEDLAQEALLRAYANLERFEGWGRFSTWLFVITRNVCAEKLRRRSMLVDPEIEPDTLPDPSAAADRALEEWEDEETLLALIRERLSDQEQDAIWLRCVEGISIETITRMLGITQATGARAVLQNARRKLQAALAQREGSRRKETR